MTAKKLTPLIIIILCLMSTNCSGTSSSKVYFRVNHAGYIPNGTKIAIVFSGESLEGKTISLLNSAGKLVSAYRLSENLGQWGNFKYHYRVDFSSIKETGKFQLTDGKQKSPLFEISLAQYEKMLPGLLSFFRVQRCGSTNPEQHEICHIYDSHTIVGDEQFGQVDVTGGWHDAGDYIKFLNTTAVSTYLLALSYQLYPDIHQSDVNKNGVPDILEEIRVGLDWMLRCNYSGTKLISQVQDMRDHDVGWRLPENDTLRYDRPAFRGEGKNIAGIYTAALAIGSKIWKEKFQDIEFAERCKSVAEKIYSASRSMPDVDSSTTGMYQDKTYYSKLCLGAVELYNLTQKGIYLQDAKMLYVKMSPDYWWSWGDINSLASYRLSEIDRKYVSLLESNVLSFNNNISNTVYGDAGIYTWGTTTTLFGIAAQGLMYKKLSGQSLADNVAFLQFDYIFGKNPWGISFVSEIGTRYSKNLHSQVAHLRRIVLPGGIAAGPVLNTILKNYEISRNDLSGSEFNSDTVSYFDDRNDYITNEPAIVTNASAIFAITLLLSQYR